MSSLLQRVEHILWPFRTVDKLDLNNDVEKAESGKYFIPDAISFEKILANETSPVSYFEDHMKVTTLTFTFQPVTLTDFMDYMVYVDQEAEDLQFFLWLRDFENRFEQLPADSKSLSPVWAQPNNTFSEKAGFLCDIGTPRDKATISTVASRLQLCKRTCFFAFDFD